MLLLEIEVVLDVVFRLLTPVGFFAFRSLCVSIAGSALPNFSLCPTSSFPVFLLLLSKTPFSGR